MHPHLLMRPHLLIRPRLPKRMHPLLRLLWFLRPLAGWVLLAVLMGVATTASGIALLGTSAYLLASAALQPSIAALQVAIVGVRFFGISRALFRYLERLVSHSVNFRHLAQLRSWIYRKIEPLAPARMVLARSADMLGNMIADIDLLEGFYVRAVAPPLVALVVVSGVCLYVGSFDGTLALALLAGLLLVGVVLPVLVYWLGRAPGRALVDHRARLQNTLLDTVQGMADLLAFHRAAAQVAAIEQDGNNLTLAQLKHARVGALGSALALLGGGLTLWLILLLAVPMTGVRFDGVSLAVLALVAMAAFEAVNPLAAAGQHLEASLQAGRRLFALADSVPAVTAPASPLPAPDTAALRIEGLTFTYPGETTPALVEFSLDLPPGKHVALVGTNGAGKSTLLRLLLRFWDAPPATIFWNGHDIRQYDPDDLRGCIAFAAHDGYVFTGTLRQNILLANPQASEPELEQALRDSQLDALVARLPEGLETWVGERGMMLSGGERQKLVLARAFLRSSPLLLLDEPAAHLDRTAERSLLETISQTRRERSLIAVTHRLEGLHTMQEILVLHQGRVVERGTHADLLARAGRYARMWEIEQGVLDSGETGA